MTGMDLVNQELLGGTRNRQWHFLIKVVSLVQRTPMQSGEWREEERCFLHPSDTPTMLWASFPLLGFQLAVVSQVYPWACPLESVIRGIG